MNDKELLKKLNTLKEIKLDSGWKQEARGILFSQISNSVAEVKVSFSQRTSVWFKKVLSASLQPAAITFGVFFLFAVGVFGAQASKGIKPGNNFYAARLLSEKVQLAVTFNKEEKEKLSVKLASNRAKEITEVLSNTDLSKEENKKKIEKLADVFKNELDNVKSGLENLNRLKEEKTVALAGVEKISVDNSDDVDVAVGIGAAGEKNDDKVFAVESEKTDKGLEIYSGQAVVDVKNNIAAESMVATSVIAALPQATTSSNNVSNKLAEAEISFTANDFAAAKELLEQVNSLLDDIDKGVKADTLTATSASPVSPASSTASSAADEIK